MAGAVTVYLSGCVRDDLPAGVGVMLTPQMGNNLPEGRTWAADTGCFAAPEKYSDDAYLSWLASRAYAADRCLFATAPDVFGDGLATLEKSRPMLPRIRALGYKAALVVQPGITPDLVPWGEIDAVFVGGPDDWHRSDTVLALVLEAKQRGKWTHQGRVNSHARLKAARVTGYDSADGTFVAFGPDANIPKVSRWTEHTRLQPTLFTLGEIA